MQKKNLRSNILSLVANDCCDDLSFLVIHLCFGTKSVGDLEEDTNSDSVTRGQELAFTLTTKVMTWVINEELEGTEMVLILDLRPCSSYWRKQAVQVHTSVEEYLVEILQTTARRICPNGQISGVFASHPWAALLLSKLMKYRKRQGFLSLNTPLGQHIYKKNLTWSLLWETIEQLQDRQNLGTERQQTKTATKKPSQKNNQFNSSTFNKGLAQLQRMVFRMGFKYVFAYDQTGALPIQRRFGVAVAHIWQWTFSLSHAPSFGDGDSFPWESCLPKQLPTVERWLDQGVDQWAHLECFLQEDFNHLSVDNRWCSIDECIVSLEWRLVLQDLTEIALPIHFRHPLSLQRELGPQSTALLQAHYTFDNWRQEQQAAIQNSDREETFLAVLETNPIIAWTLTITCKTPRTQTCGSLFGFDDGLTKDLERLNSLANKLPRPFLHYHLQNDWGVKDSFGEHSLVNPGRVEVSAGDMTFVSMMAQGRVRPLYVFSEPQLICNENRFFKKSKMKFLERRTDKWWERFATKESSHQFNSEQAPCYDYFQVTDERNRALWVCMTPLKKWYIHGIFA